MLVLELLCAFAMDIPELGQDPLSRADLLNFDDFSEVSLEELMEPERVRFNINLFGSVGVEAGLVGGQIDRDYFNFYQGNSSLLASGELGDRVRMQTELTFEAEVGEPPRVEAERLYIRYAGHRGFVLAGRVSTPIDFWNVAFHHGTWIQPSITRPLILSYEHDSGILPTQSVGVFAGSNVPFSKSSLYFILGFANGRGPEEEMVQSNGDIDFFKEAIAQIYYTRGSSHRFRLGYSTWYDRIPVPEDPMKPVAFHEYGASLNLLYQSEHLMFLTEWFTVVHQSAAQVWWSEDMFFHVGYRVNHITPYTRIEWYAPDINDPYFVSDPADNPLVQRTEAIFGTRFDIAEWASLRAEYHLGHEDTLTHSAMVDISFGI